MEEFEGDSSEGAPHRDGSSPQTAIRVDSVAAEYDWLRKHLPDYHTAVQALGEFEGRPLDIHMLRTEAGDERQVFFDISSFFARERKRSSAKPCPYCGAELRTEKAMQCFSCGMDWRDPSNVVRRGRA